MGQMSTKHGPNKNPRVVLGLSLLHVGQHDTAHTFIRAVPCLALRHEHDINGPRAGPARPDGEQPGHLEVDEAKGGGLIQLRVRVYRSDECDVSGIMACSSAIRGAGIYVEHVIAKGGQQVRHCNNNNNNQAF
jgi:hypothetical protein